MGTAARPSAGTARIGRNAAIYLTGGILQRGGALFALLALTRVVSREQVGAVTVAIAVANFLSIVFALGLTTAIVRIFYDDVSKARRTAWATVLRLQLGAGTALAVIAWMTLPVWGNLVFRDSGWTSGLQLAVGYGLALSVQTVTQGVLRAAGRPIAFVTLSILSSVLGCGAGLAMARWWGGAGFLAGTAGGAALAALVGLTITYHRPRWTVTVVWGTIALGIPFLVHGLATFGLTLSDRLIVEHYLGSVEVARYYLAFVIGTAIFIALDAANSAWAPYYFSLPAGRRATMPGRLMYPAIVVGAACALVVAAIAPVLVRVLAPGYGSPLAIVGLIAASTCTRAVYFLCVVVTTQEKDSVSSAISSILGTATLIAVDVLLIDRLGITAAAVGVYAAFLVQAVVIHARAARLVRLPSLVLLVPLWLAIAAAVTGVALLPGGPWWIVRAAVATASAVVLLRKARMMRGAAATRAVNGSTAAVSVEVRNQVRVSA